MAFVLTLARRGVQKYQSKVYVLSCINVEV